MTLEQWWYAALAISFIGIAYERANTALFVVFLVAGLVVKSI